MSACGPGRVKRSQTSDSRKSLATISPRMVDLMSPPQAANRLIDRGFQFIGAHRFRL
jgi:hypothetical protein